MQQYLNYLQNILTHGTKRMDRTGVGIISMFGYQMRFNLSEGFPLVTTKQVAIKSIIHELLWFLRGDTNVRYLQQHGVSIWDPWADAEGNLGPIYGKQWRAWRTCDGRVIDQMQWVVDHIKRDPYSRRLIVNAWNVGELDKMALPPCHLLFQFYVAENTLSCHLYQRSADSFLGVPFNIASYALLTHMVAQQCGLQPGDFVWSGGDCHIYLNHLQQVTMQLNRQPLPLPQLVLRRCPASLFDYVWDDITIVNYQSHPPLKGEIAV